MSSRQDDEDRALAASVQLSSDRYHIDRQLGVGGMATVYRAWDDHEKDWVAIKVLNPALLGRPQMRRRFEIEALALQKLDHRNIVKVLDTDLTAEQPYIVMELAEGGCLIDWIREYGPMPPRMAVDAAIQICKGVAVAHVQGIVHRDIKPHNILMNHRGVCKLTDFGIAQLDAEGLDLTRSGQMMGTMGYVAPEQRADASRVDERVDVYSIGASFYTMLTGKVAADLFYAEKDPSMLEGVPEELRGVLLKATAYDPDERYPDVTELAKALHALRTDLPPTPSDTPSLVMRRDEEVLEPPPPPPAEITYAGIGTTPAPARRMVIEPPPEEPPRRGGLIAGGAVLLAVAAGVLSALLLPSVDEERLRIEQAYYGALLEHEAIIEDLARLGADRRAVAGAWRAQAEASDPEARRAAADAYVELLRREVAARAANPRIGQRASAREARARLDAIERAQRRERMAREAASSSGCGS